MPTEVMAMVEGKMPISPVNVAPCPDHPRKTLEEQGKLWGVPLYPYFFYAPLGLLPRREVDVGRPSREHDARARYAEGCWRTAGSRGGTAATTVRTLMPPKAAGAAFRQRRSTRSTITRRARSSATRRRWRSSTPTRLRTRTATSTTSCSRASNGTTTTAQSRDHRVAECVLTL
jgi:hypothetical protein